MRPTGTTDVRALRRAVMGVSPARATAFSRGDTPAWTHLEGAVLAAVGGYHMVLDDSRITGLAARLGEVEPGLRGYACEGAAMGLTVLDLFLPWRSRLSEYLTGPGMPHVYMAHIGAGEALALLHRRPEPFVARMEDKVLSWLVLDGYGFHRGFFARRRYVARRRVPARLSAPARRVFDQGLGRSIWFTAGAQVGDVAAAIERFPVERRADLWTGIGVACSYVGGVDRAMIVDLRRIAGAAATGLAVGSAFVAKGRQRAGNPVPHTDLACEVLCGGISSGHAARLVDVAFAGLPTDGPEPAYLVLQRRLAMLLEGPGGDDPAAPAGPDTRGIA